MNELIKQDFITPNKYSRPGKYSHYFKRHFEPRGLAYHYVGNPGTTAQNNRDYMNSQTWRHRPKGAHIFLNSVEIIQTIPFDEFTYHVGAHKYTDLAKKRFMPYPNLFLIGIEMCHPDETGIFSKSTLRNGINLGIYLCKRFNFNPFKDIFTHNMITGKDCPRWWVTWPEEFDEFRMQIEEGM